MAAFIQRKQEREKPSNFQCLCWKIGVNLSHSCQCLKYPKQMMMPGKGQEEDAMLTPSVLSISAQLFMIFYHVRTEASFYLWCGAAVRPRQPQRPRRSSFHTSYSWNTSEFHAQRKHLQLRSKTKLTVWWRLFWGDWKTSTFRGARRGKRGTSSDWCLGIEPNPRWRAEGREPKWLIPSHTHHLSCKYVPTPTGRHQVTLLLSRVLAANTRKALDISCCSPVI